MTQDYIAPVMVQAYNDPATAYGDMVKLGKEVATITKVIFYYKFYQYFGVILNYFPDLPRPSLEARSESKRAR